MLTESLQELKNKGEAPEFLTDEAFQMLRSGYLQPEETPKAAYKRVASVVAAKLKRPDLEGLFFDIIWKNWLCPSTPVLANIGTKNLPISCFGGLTPDSTNGILMHAHELGMLSKYGGGVGTYFGELRPRGSRISSGGVTDGIVPFLKIIEATVEGIKQGSSRRGSVAAYLPFNHGDIDDFLDIRKPTGDLSRRCLTTSFHNAVVINDETMEDIVNSNGKNRERWNKLMNNRVETGEPYIMFEGNSNKNCPDGYAGRIKHSQLCSEIFLPSSEEETFVCCLSSLNLSRWDEWKDWKDAKTSMNLVELSVWFLDGVMSVFIDQAKGLPGFDKAVRFAENHRALGLGVLGWHSLLQKNMIPFESFRAMTLNNAVFRQIKEQADKATLDLGAVYGECLETKGTGRRNTVTLAVAPTMSNSVLGGGVSQGIEPITANLFVQKGAKGNFIKKNPFLDIMLKEKGLDTFDVWEQINKDRGSVRNIKGLSDEEKSVFLTAREINQFSLIQQAAQRQRYIDQGQSLNLFFSLPEKAQDKVKVAKYINEVHIEAWKQGIKSLYYLKTASPIKGEVIARDSSECVSCEG